MGECLITQEGEPHRRRRALLQPSFASARIAAGGRAIVDQAERLSNKWQEGETIDTRREMARVAITAASQILFAIDLEPEAEAIVAALGVMLHAISRPPIPRPRLSTARRLLQQVAARMNRGHLVEQLRAPGLNDKAVQDEIVSLLIASVDTTPGTLAWIWFVLASHPMVEERLHAELQSVLAGRRPTIDDLPHLQYLDRVISEVLRLYPPVHFIDRRALADMELGGVQLRAGDYILLSPLLTQRDGRFFDRPSEFDPERWQNGAHKPLPHAYFPFGAGPHACIGMGLATKEMALVVATLAQCWRLRHCANVPPDPSPQTTYLPMTLERRS